MTGYHKALLAFAAALAMAYPSLSGYSQSAVRSSSADSVSKDVLAALLAEAGEPSPHDKPAMDSADASPSHDAPVLRDNAVSADILADLLAEAGEPPPSDKPAMDSVDASPSHDAPAPHDNVVPADMLADLLAEVGELSPHEKPAMDSADALPSHDAPAPRNAVVFADAVPADTLAAILAEAGEVSIDYSGIHLDYSGTALSSQEADATLADLPHADDTIPVILADSSAVAGDAKLYVMADSGSPLPENASALPAVLPPASDAAAAALADSEPSAGNISTLPADWPHSADAIAYVFADASELPAPGSGDEPHSADAAASDDSLLPRPVHSGKHHARDAWVVNFKDTDLQTVIHQIAEMTGESYIIPPSVTGKVNVVSQTPLGKKEVKELLLSLLYINGFTVVPSGNSLLIEPSGDAKKSNSPVTQDKTEGNAFITRIIQVRYVSANELMDAVQPLVSDFAVAKQLPDSNALLIADRADNVEKIAKIVAGLDSPESTGIESVRLNKSWVGDIMPLLNKIAPRELGAAGKATISPIRVVGDEHSNTIILKGDADARAHMRTLIAELDQPAGSGASVQVIKLHDADATKMADVLKDMFTAPGTATAADNIPVSIKPSVRNNALVVHAAPNVIEQIRNIVSQLDIQQEQVLIEAAIVEVDDDLLGQLGIQFGAGQAFFQSNLLTSSLTAGTSGALAAANPSLATLVQNLNLPNSTLVGGGVTGVFSKSSHFTALVQALASNSHANLLSTPSITTVNNEEAKILVGQNVPFITGSYSLGTTSGSTVNPFNTVQRQDIGITLKVTPQIHEGNRVLLKVDQEVSSIAPTTVSGAADIITNKRSIDTSILAANGQTIALGGLITTNKNTDKSQVPILGDLPLFGPLFQSTSEENVKSDLIVFLRPTIISDDQDITAVNMRKYKDVWEFEMGKAAKDNPLTTDQLPDAMDNLYTPDMHKPPVLLPWLNFMEN